MPGDQLAVPRRRLVLAHRTQRLLLLGDHGHRRHQHHELHLIVLDPHRRGGRLVVLVGRTQQVQHDLGLVLVQQRPPVVDLLGLDREVERGSRLEMLGVSVGQLPGPRLRGLAPGPVRPSHPGELLTPVDAQQLRVRRQRGLGGAFGDRHRDALAVDVRDGPQGLVDDGGPLVLVRGGDLIGGRSRVVRATAGQPSTAHQSVEDERPGTGGRAARTHVGAQATGRDEDTHCRREVHREQRLRHVVPKRVVRVPGASLVPDPVHVCESPSAPERGLDPCCPSQSTDQRRVLARPGPTVTRTFAIRVPARHLEDHVPTRGLPGAQLDLRRQRSSRRDARVRRVAAVVLVGAVRHLGVQVVARASRPCRRCSRP